MSDRVPPVFKIADRAAWEETQRTGVFPPAPVDVADGFIHFSTAEQARETARRHFAGRQGLVLLSVDPSRLPPDALRWEPSRGGDLFPHLYGDLLRTAIVAAQDLPLGPDGLHRFPDS